MFKQNISGFSGLAELGKIGVYSTSLTDKESGLQKGKRKGCSKWTDASGKAINHWSSETGYRLALV